mmetsp:Transcript_21841/g.33178  ORF Transcript_21841/g.33178 Transcript_21841/m.33178 type:complete len:204 (-) Transcript_21841:228-839(-)
MPATAGRVHMPHNNRISTSGALATSDIWSKTIGHDPYAATSEGGASGAAEDEEKAKGLMALARHQKIAGEDTSGRDNFSQRLYLGLKKKKRRGKDTLETEVVDPDYYKLLQERESSSEEEFIEVEGEPSSDKREKKRRKRKSKRRKRDHESSDDSSSAREGENEKKEKTRKKERKRNNNSSSDDTSSRDRRRRRKKKSRKRHR